MLLVSVSTGDVAAIKFFNYNLIQCCFLEMKVLLSHFTLLGFGL